MYYSIIIIIIINNNNNNNGDILISIIMNIFSISAVLMMQLVIQGLQSLVFPTTQFAH